MASVEEFAERLNEALINRHKHSGAGREYVLTGDLQRAIAQALQPENPDEQFPMMMYLRGDRNRQRTVQSAEEEAAAQAQGFVRTPLAPPEPKYFVERPRSEGGTSYDLRRTVVFTPQEEAQFYSATEPGTWIEDDVTNQYGARGVSLAAVIAERKEQLKSMIDAQPLATEPEINAPEGEE